MALESQDPEGRDDLQRRSYPAGKGRAKSSLSWAGHPAVKRIEISQINISICIHIE
jgi:hypothetical protein